jgi:hypothetical protein
VLPLLPFWLSLLFPELVASVLSRRVLLLLALLQAEAGTATAAWLLLGTNGNCCSAPVAALRAPALADRSMVAGPPLLSASVGY